MYQALYRKWRPRVFADVVGQSHVTDTLRRQVAAGRTSHAYLFTGTRGTGKTTCAKILARAVNCEHPNDGDPCCECPSCVGLEDGSFLDVLELDAASNNGVDQVRALRDEAVYAPANVKTRVYIVDEVHMLSTPAFNALLKILEEPPEHLMFILATTELHKVPATILSRCQRYNFRRIQPKDVEERLSYVAKQEGIDLKPDGAELLSRLADGALRDGLSLLDQCAASGGTVDAGAVLETLGLAGRYQTAELMEHVLNRDAAAALSLLSELYRNGKDVGAVIGELSDLTRDLLVLKTAPKGGAALLSGGYDGPTLDRLGKSAGASRLLYMAAVLQKAGAELYNSANRRTDAELCMLRLCDETLSDGVEALAARVESLEAAVSSGVKVQTVTAGGGAARTASPVREAVPVRKPSPAKAEPPAREPAITSAAPPPVQELNFTQTDANFPPWDMEPPPPPEEPGDWDGGGSLAWDDEDGRTDVPSAPSAQRPEPGRGAAVQTGAPTEPQTREVPESREVWERAAVAQTREGPESAAVPETAVTPDGPAAPSVVPGWPELLQRCSPRLAFFIRPFFAKCTGAAAGDTYTIYAPDSSTLHMVDTDSVRNVLTEESGAARILFREGTPPPESPEENRRELVAMCKNLKGMEITGEEP